MKAKEFYQKLTTQIYSNSGDRGKVYAEKIYRDSTRYTQYIKEIIGEILSNIKNRIKLKSILNIIVLMFSHGKKPMILFFLKNRQNNLKNNFGNP